MAKKTFRRKESPPATFYQLSILDEASNVFLSRKEWYVANYIKQTSRAARDDNAIIPLNEIEPEMILLLVMADFFCDIFGIVLQHKFNTFC